MKIRKFELDDAQCLYKIHLEEDVKKWVPNESYADIEETREAISFYPDPDIEVLNKMKENKTRSKLWENLPTELEYNKRC